MKNTGANKVLREVLLLVLYFVSAQYLCAGFLTRWGEKLSRDLPATLANTIQRPFAYRVLTPAVLNIAIATLPREPVEKWLAKPLDEASSRRLMDDAVSRYRIDESLAFEFLVLELFLLAVAVAIAYATRSLLKEVGLSECVSCLMPSMLLIVLPLHFAGGGYVYDLPEILLATIAARQFVAGRWWVYYAVLVLAVLNKESSLVFVGFCLAFVLRGDMRLAFRHVALHALVMAPPFLFTRWWFADMAGSHAMFYLWDNMRFLASVDPYVGRERLISAFVPTPIALNAVLVGVVAGLLLHEWRAKPAILRAMFVGSVALVVPLYLVFGWRNEIRVFGMAFPVACCLASYTLQKLLGLDRCGHAWQAS